MVMLGKQINNRCCLQSFTQLKCSNNIMASKNYQKRLKIFLNEPGLLKHYLDRSNSPTSKAERLKSIFPPAPQLERFRHLENARISGQRDLSLDGEVLNIINKFEWQVTANVRLNSQLQMKRENCLSKLKMDYVQQQITENLQELQKLINQHEHYSGLIDSEKGFVEKMILTTEIKKALLIQNSILKQENETLKKQEDDLDTLVRGKNKK